MKTIGTYEAKSHWSQLLKRVSRGEKVLITRRGRAIAMLVPYGRRQRDHVLKAIQAMKELRKGNVLGDDLTIRDLIEEGRRF